MATRCHCINCRDRLHTPGVLDAVLRLCKWALVLLAINTVVAVCSFVGGA
jgi:hypothetical protein